MKKSIEDLKGKFEEISQNVEQSKKTHSNKRNSKASLEYSITEW